MIIRPSLYATMVCALIFFQGASAEKVSLKANGKTFNIDTAKPIHFEKIAGKNPTATFNALIKEFNVVFDFYAQWCPPCKKMLPILDAVAPELPANTIIVKIDSDSEEASDICQTHSIRSLPTFMFFKKGSSKPSETVSGGMSKKDFKGKIEKHFGEAASETSKAMEIDEDEDTASDMDID